MNVEFWFKCPNCGEYKVSEKIFMNFAPSNYHKQLRKKITQGAAGAAIEFDSKCPKCCPKGVSATVGKVLWPPGLRKEKTK